MNMKERHFIFIILNVIGLILCVVLLCALLELGDLYKSLFGGFLIGWIAATHIWEILEFIVK